MICIIKHKTVCYMYFFKCYVLKIKSIKSLSLGKMKKFIDDNDNWQISALLILNWCNSKKIYAENPQRKSPNGIAQQKTNKLQIESEISKNRKRNVLTLLFAKTLQTNIVPRQNNTLLQSS